MAPISVVSQRRHELEQLMKIFIPEVVWCNYTVFKNLFNYINKNIMFANLSHCWGLFWIYRHQVWDYIGLFLMRNIWEAADSKHRLSINTIPWSQHNKTRLNIVTIPYPYSSLTPRLSWTRGCRKGFVSYGAVCLCQTGALICFVEDVIR